MSAEEHNKELFHSEERSDEPKPEEARNEPMSTTRRRAPKGLLTRRDEGTES